jgi:hypothetical protein
MSQTNIIMMVDTDFAQWEKEKEAHTMFELL